MRDQDCVAFLQWALPRLNLRWRGYRKVRRQVCKRIQRRIDALGITLGAYRERVKTDAAELARLDDYCQITISRFYRDHRTWEYLLHEALPKLAREARDEGRDKLRAWSIGSASGEEPYTLSLLWHLELAGSFPAMGIDILATDTHPVMLERAERSCYARGSLKALPDEWRESGFRVQDDEYCLRGKFREPVRLLRHDVRDAPPQGRFDLILCRNLVFTYFDTGLQGEVLERLTEATRTGSVLVLGSHESLPGPHPAWAPIDHTFYRRNGHRS
jgi:chemotaxis protein methyltransferase CheR